MDEPVRVKVNGDLDIQGTLTTTGPIIFDGGVQDVTFNDGGAPYTLQDAFDFKQNSIVAYTPAGSTQLFSADATNGYIKALKAGTNITLTNDSASVTINGPITSGFQSTLAAATATDAHAILNGTTIKCLKSGAFMRYRSSFC